MHLTDSDLYTPVAQRSAARGNPQGSSCIDRCHLAVGTGISLFLILIGLLKLHFLWVERPQAIAGTGLLIAALLELALGLWCWTGRRSKLCFSFIMLVFSAFFLYSAFSFFRTNEPCNCLGRFRTSPGVAAAISLGVVALASWLRARQKPPAEESTKRRAAMIHLSVTAALSLLGAIALLTGIDVFGRIQGIAVSQSKFAFVWNPLEEQYHEFEVKLVNYTSSPVRIVGSNVECGPLELSGLPCEIPPFGESRLKFFGVCQPSDVSLEKLRNECRMKDSRFPVSMIQKATIYTDSERSPSLSIAVTVTFDCIQLL